MLIVLFNQFICPVFGLVLIERFTQRGYPACAARLEIVWQIKVNDYFGTTVFFSGLSPYCLNTKTHGNPTAAAADPWLIKKVIINLSTRW
ncbi:TPA: hypothetical protein ACT9K3_001030 [Legionella pneumophila]